MVQNGRKNRKFNLKTLSEDVTEAIGAVAVELTLRVDELDSHYPYRYEPFGGFPGFWRFCGVAGFIFAQGEISAKERLVDQYIDAVGEFADMVIAACKESPPGDRDLKKMARECVEKHIGIQNGSGQCPAPENRR